MAQQAPIHAANPNNGTGPHRGFKQKGRRERERARPKKNRRCPIFGWSRGRRSVRHIRTLKVVSSVPPLARPQRLERASSEQISDGRREQKAPPGLRFARDNLQRGNIVRCSSRDVRRRRCSVVYFLHFIGPRACARAHAVVVQRIYGFELRNYCYRGESACFVRGSLNLSWSERTFCDEGWRVGLWDDGFEERFFWGSVKFSVVI